MTKTKEIKQQRTWVEEIFRSNAANGWFLVFYWYFFCFLDLVS
jgi:hypothetical protein